MTQVTFSIPGDLRTLTWKLAEVESREGNQDGDRLEAEECLSGRISGQCDPSHTSPLAED